MTPHTPSVWPVPVAEDPVEEEGPALQARLAQGQAVLEALRQTWGRGAAPALASGLVAAAALLGPARSDSPTALARRLVEEAARWEHLPHAADAGPAGLVMAAAAIAAQASPAVLIARWGEAIDRLQAAGVSPRAPGALEALLVITVLDVPAEALRATVAALRSHYPWSREPACHATVALLAASAPPPPDGAPAPVERAIACYRALRARGFSRGPELLAAASILARAPIPAAFALARFSEAAVACDQGGVWPMAPAALVVLATATCSPRHAAAAYQAVAQAHPLPELGWDIPHPLRLLLQALLAVPEPGSRTAAEEVSSLLALVAACTIPPLDPS